MIKSFKGEAAKNIAKEIQGALAGKKREDKFYGIRIDVFAYKVGDEADYSHLRYQDCIEDEDGNPVYPMDEFGTYDAGDLGGTCAFEFDPEDAESIERAVTMLDPYYWSDDQFLHVVSGGDVYGNNGDGEIIYDAIVEWGRQIKAE